MADSTFLAPELSDAESMGEETVRFQELLLKASKELQQAQTARPESTQIQPKPGFCIKTNSSEGKVFINICHSPSIPPPVDVTEDELLQMLEEDQAGFRIPMSLGEPHAELDAKGQGCTAYDVAVNSNFYLRMQNSDFLRELVVTIAREGLEDKYGLQLNPEWRMLKYRSFLGSISQQNIRSQQRPRIQELGTLDASDSLGTQHGPERPHLSLWLEAPDLLLAEVNLPKLGRGLTLSSPGWSPRAGTGDRREPPGDGRPPAAVPPGRLHSPADQYRGNQGCFSPQEKATDGVHAPPGRIVLTSVSCISGCS
ncbi:PIH1 domain-containing protein 1 isoform X2 [Arvicanthis niloticus]|nr:PIH1 domain-containing protein 1 isoform X2 [Arvicanthis niloticus]XP_034357418.1 PIH1 domain-containing protein 1 isoform X2 [Arvicanthis niloticus]XP_034357419.1 PIH1 domain-containing protein 1 isoform X2 [Arvicanthis niloticus]